MRSSLRKLKQWTSSHADPNKNEHAPENAQFKENSELANLNRPTGIVKQMVSSLSSQIQFYKCENNTKQDSFYPRKYASFNLKQPLASTNKTKILNRNLDDSSIDTRTQRLSSEYYNSDKSSDENTVDTNYQFRGRLLFTLEYINSPERIF